MNPVRITGFFVFKNTSKLTPRILFRINFYKRCPIIIAEVCYETELLGVQKMRQTAGRQQGGGRDHAHARAHGAWGGSKVSLKSGKLAAFSFNQRARVCRAMPKIRSMPRILARSR